MQIAADPVRQAAQSRCSLWWVSQNTCWRWVSEQRASSHSSMWFYFSLVWAQWWIFWSIMEPQTERGRGWKCLKTPASWNAHARSTRPGMPSGPTALWIFTRLKDRVTSATEMEIALASSATAVHCSWFVPFKIHDVIDALPHASCVVGVELFFNFVFILSFGSFDGFPEIVTGLFSIVKVPGFKGRCPRWQGCSNIAVNQRFLVGVDADCFGRHNVLYALPDETRYRIWVRLYVVIRHCPEHVPVHVIKTVLQYSVRLVRPALNCPEGGCFSFQFLPISRQEQNGRMIRFAERWAGERFVGIPERRVAVVQYTITTRVDGDVLKVFWSYCSEVGFVKVPRNNKRCIWVRVSCSLIFPYSSLSAWSVLAWGGMYTAAIMIAVNSLGSQNGWHRSIWNSRSGEQKDLMECRFLSSHHELLIKKQTPPPLLFPVSSFVLSERCTENPVSSMAESGTTADIHVSVRQIMQQSLVSRWYEMRIIC